MSEPNEPTLSRRGFLTRSAQIAGGALGVGALASLAWPEKPKTPSEEPTGYGPLVRDAAGQLDLPAGFSYVTLSPTGAPMDDGLLVPGMHDGMAAFPGRKGTVILVRNHEQDLRGWSPFGKGHARLTPAIRRRLYDGLAPCLGGTTTLVYDPQTQLVTTSFLSLGGTARNCSGGPTPWGSWLSCEETNSLKGSSLGVDHGYVFEVPARATPALEAPVPLVGLGRFVHEAVAVDSATGILYLTEDRGDGLLYRFLPSQRGKLVAGGRLQALVVDDLRGATTHNWDRTTVPVGHELSVSWVDLQNPESPLDDLRKQGANAGATTFTRGEGIFPGGGGIYFSCTDGGSRRSGQLWQYRPGLNEATAKAGEPTGTLKLIAEPNDPSVFHMIDNLTISPWSDVIACEDGGGGNSVVGITPQGAAYPLAFNAANESEFAGATFSPDGSTLFVNVQFPGVTYAIRGPWRGAQPR